jgi:hypothetical protein
VLCVFPLCLSSGCWLGLAPRSSSTSVAAWTWQEKLVEVHEWNRGHRPNSWIEFLSAPIHSPPLWFATSVLQTCSLCPGRLDRMSWAVRTPLWELTAWGRLDHPKKPALHQTFQKLPEPLWTPYKCFPVPKSCTNFSPLLTMHELRKNAKRFYIELFKYTKFIITCYTCPNEQVRYSIAS